MEKAPYPDSQAKPPETATLTSKIATSTGWVIAWRLVTRNLGLISTLILVRLLQPADFGLVALASAFAATVDALSAFGVQDALIRLPEPSRATYDSAFWLSVARGAATALILAACAWPVAAFFNEPRLTVVIFALAVATFVTGFENIGITDFRRHMQFRKEFHLQVVPRVAGIVVTVTMAAIWHEYTALIAGILTTRVARLAQSYMMSPFRPRWGLSDWRLLIGFSLWNWALSILSQVRDRLDSFIIGRTMNTTDVALFSVGQEIGSLPITEMVEPLHRTLFSAFVLLNSGAGEIRKLYLNSLEAGFLVVLPAGIGMSMVADPAVRLTLGDKWISSIPVVQILAAASVLSVFRLISDSIFGAAGRMRLSFILVSLSTLFRVPLLLVLVQWAGLTGAAVALAISALIDQVLYTGTTLHRLFIPIGEFLARLWRSSVACACMIGCMWAVGMAWTPGPAMGTLAITGELLLRSGFGAACYTVCLLGVWIAAGRPDGAERYLLGRVQGIVGSLGQMFG